MRFTDCDLVCNVCLLYVVAMSKTTALFCEKHTCICHMYSKRGTENTMYKVAGNRLSPLYRTDIHQPLHTQDGLFTGVDVAKMSIEDLQAMGKFISAVGDAYVMVLNARTKENVARKAIIDAEIAQVREKRSAPIPDAAPRHKLARVELTLDQNGPLHAHQK